MLSSVSCALKAQDLSQPFTLKCYFKGIQSPNGYAYLTGIMGGKVVVDSVKMVNDRFEFKGSAEPTELKVFIKRFNKPYFTNPLTLFIDKGSIEVSAVYDTTHATHLKDVKIKGSAVNDEFENYQRESKSYAYGSWKAYDQLFADYKIADAAKDSVKLKSIQVVANSIFSKIDEFRERYIQENPKSFISLYLVSKNSKTSDAKTLARTKELFMRLDTSIQFSMLGKKVAENMVYASTEYLMGRPAGDFEQPTVEGKKVKLSDYKGKYVLLDFWASWCAPCRAENPNVLRAYNKYKSKGFDILAVSLDTNVEKWKKAIAEDKLPWVQASDLKEINNAVVQQFGISRIPDNFLIDPNGIVIARGLRGDGLDKKLAEIFTK